jgi:hypothetical protein
LGWSAEEDSQNEPDEDGRDDQDQDHVTPPFGHHGCKLVDAEIVPDPEPPRFRLVGEP